MRRKISLIICMQIKHRSMLRSGASNIFIITIPHAHRYDPILCIYKGTWSDDTELKEPGFLGRCSTEFRLQTNKDTADNEVIHMSAFNHKEYHHKHSGNRTEMHSASATEPATFILPKPSCFAAREQGLMDSRSVHSAAMTLLCTNC
jgi:hypothetical protein